MEHQTYYNAKPSNISNIGHDVAGAKRMNFDTYETTAEREARKSTNKNKKQFKEAFKDAVLTANRGKLLMLLHTRFLADHGFAVDSPDAHAIIMERRKTATNESGRREFNGLVNDYNRTNREIRKITRSDYSFRCYVETASRRYQPKDSFVDETGSRFDWKKFEANSDIASHLEFLKLNTSAVQFGNSVSDKERAYISQELAKFLKDWQVVEGLNNISLSSLNWSFGARGKTGSVAYYQQSGNIISVNRNNIGSLIHEVGHFLDANAYTVSRNISHTTVGRYADTLPLELTPKQRGYYCSRSEIFARAFEAYCYKIYAGFSPFAQSGKDLLPELDDELIGLIETALRIRA